MKSRNRASGRWLQDTLRGAAYDKFSARTIYCGGNMNQPASASDRAVASLSPSPEVVFTAWIDLYKHHFELWLRGFFVYLGVLGVVAGFFFSEDSSRQVRAYLLVLIIVASTVAILAFSVGLRWLSVFGTAFRERSSGTGAPPLAIAPFKCVVSLGIVVAIAFIVAAIYLHPRLDDFEHLQKDSLAPRPEAGPGTARAGETTS
jgi:hypothetical protein